MIRALSPYYIDTDLVYGGTTCERFTLTVQIWDGAKASPDSTNEYKITYENTLGSTGSHKINISSMIQDYVEFNVPTSFSVGQVLLLRWGITKLGFIPTLSMTELLLNMMRLLT